MRLGFTITSRKSARHGDGRCDGHGEGVEKGERGFVPAPLIIASKNYEKVLTERDD